MKRQLLAALLLALVIPSLALADPGKERRARPERSQGRTQAEDSGSNGQRETRRETRVRDTDESTGRLERSPDAERIQRERVQRSADRGVQRTGDGVQRSPDAASRWRGWGSIDLDGRRPNDANRDVSRTRYRTDYRTYPRSRVVVRYGWPIHRAQRYVIVRPARYPWYVSPSVFLWSRPWSGAWIHTPPRQPVVWHDREKLYGEDSWTEFSLTVRERGSRIGMQIDGGEVQIDWAEIVYSNGETEVVDFDNQYITPGEYELLEFDGRRTVDHVRMVARADSYSATIGMLMDR